MAAGLCEVVVERLAEFVVAHLVDEVGQRLLGELTLDIEDVAELVEEELAW